MAKRPTKKKRPKSQEKAEQPSASLFSRDEIDEIKTMALSDPEKATLQMRALVNAKRMESYKIDAIQSSPSRRVPRQHTTSLDDELPSDWNRETLIATSRDLDLNFSLVEGIIETHLDYVVGKGPLPVFNSGDAKYDVRALAWFRQWSKECDIRGLMNFGTYARVTERGSVTDGDSGTHILDKANNFRLQAIEGDRVRDHEKSKKRGNKLNNGVETNRVGRPVAYHVYRRVGKLGSSSKVFQRRIVGEDFLLHFHPRRFDQSRGLPGLTSAINTLQDIREILEAVKGTVKLENLIALFIESDAPETDGLDILGEPEVVTTGDGKTRSEIVLDSGINVFDLARGEKMTSLKKETPNNMFKDFMLLLVRIAAASMGMPLEIALANFTGGGYASQRGTFLKYFKYVDKRRDTLVFKFLDPVAVRLIDFSFMRFDGGFENGLEPPEGGGNPYPESWQFPGLPMLDPQKERMADALGLKIGSTTLARIALRDGGGDWESNMTQRAKELCKAIELAGDKFPFTLLSQPFDPGTDLGRTPDEPPPATNQE